MGNYKLTPSANELDISFEGSFTPDDAKHFVEDFNKAVAAVNPADCHLNLDGSKLAISPAQMVDLLRSCFVLYKNAGFQHVTLNPGSNAVLRMQVNRLAKEAGLTDFELR